MPETSPPSSLRPPTKSGSGAFIAAAVIMLLIMGGLIYWKVSGTKEEPKPVASAPPPPKEEVVFEEPPPPPPPPEEDAGEEKKVVRKGGGGGVPKAAGGCSGACKGNATAQIKSALRARAGQARGCYNRALRLNATLQGKLTVAVRISPTGSVCSASITNNSLGDASVAACVVQMFRSASFPAPQGGCVDTAIPMNFVPKT